MLKKLIIAALFVLAIDVGNIYLYPEEKLSYPHVFIKASSSKQQFQMENGNIAITIPVEEEVVEIFGESKEYIRCVDIFGFFEDRDEICVTKPDIVFEISGQILKITDPPNHALIITQSEKETFLYMISDQEILKYKAGMLP